MFSKLYYGKFICRWVDNTLCSDDTKISYILSMAVITQFTSYHIHLYPLNLWAVQAFKRLL